MPAGAPKAGGRRKGRPTARARAVGRLDLHGSDVRQQAIADDLSELAGPALRKGKGGYLVAKLRADRARSGHERPQSDPEGRNADDLEAV